jgi:hypothetical protein
MTNHTPLLHDKLAWDGKTLVITGEGLVEKKLRRKALSASTSKSMQSCAARCVGERLLRSEEENPFDPAPLGMSAHGVLEDLFDIESTTPRCGPGDRSVHRGAQADPLWADNPEAGGCNRRPTAPADEELPRSRHDQGDGQGPGRQRVGDHPGQRQAPWGSR